MKNVINCFKEDNPVIQKKLRRVTVEEGYKIATELFEILNKRKDGIGLAANQVGIDAAVAVVNVREPIVLINPEIVSRETEIPYYEGCLSFPGKGCHTKRYETIEVKSDNVDGTMVFSGVDTGEEAKGTWEDGQQKQNRELRTLEAVCVQHEIDHLNGMRILDRAQELTIRRTERKIGRNEPCPCGSGKKYKKCCIGK
jgi:peptide deformylase|tara:strand:+ start:322 stop:915 length:594 start_codon:yes stop_codon:yes gene_type:complete